MTLNEALKPYRDADGLVRPALGVDSNNGVLYTSMALVLSRLLPGRNGMDTVIEFGNITEKCDTAGEGLLRRSSTCTDQEGPDDYIGYLAASGVCGQAFCAHDVIAFGKAHNGFFNNECPGTYKHRDGSINWSAFLARQPQLIAHAYFAAGLKPIVPLRAYWALSIALSGWRAPLSDTDSRILPWLMVKTNPAPNWLERKAIAIFKARLMKDYGVCGMQIVMTTAFGVTHPLASYMVAF